MGWLKDWFTSAPKVVDDVFDSEKGLLAKAGAWYGNQEFTAEEVAEMNYEQAKDVRKFVVDTLNESTDRSRSRRSIAVFFMKFFALMLFMCGMTYPINAEWSQVWFNMATSASVGGTVTAICIFFFGSHALARKQEAEKK